MSYTTQFLKLNIIGTSNEKPLGRGMYTVDATVKGLPNRIPLLMYVRHASKKGKDSLLLSLIHKFDVIGKWIDAEDGTECFLFKNDYFHEGKYHGPVLAQA